MEQHYQQSFSVDYSLKEGETLVLQIKNNRSGGHVKSKFFEQGASNSSEEKSEIKESISITRFAYYPQKSPTDSPTKLILEKSAEVETSKIVKEKTEHGKSPEKQSTQDVVDDDFYDFQAVG